MGGVSMKGDAVRQAGASARTIEKLLREVGTRLPVKPVVLYSDRFVEGGPRGPDDPWVLNPKAFLKWLQKQSRILTEAGVHDLYKRVLLKLG